MFEPMICCAVEVQPFAGLVTVKVYVPAAVTVGFCVAFANPPGPDQLYVAPEVVELPPRFTDVAVHVKF